MLTAYTRIARYLSVSLVASMITLKAAIHSNFEFLQLMSIYSSRISRTIIIMEEATRIPIVV